MAETESGVVGWVHGTEQELLESGQRCEILGLVVDPAYRSQGVGRRLVTAVEQWAARLGYVRAKTQHAYPKALSGAPSPGGADPRSFP